LDVEDNVGGYLSSDSKGMTQMDFKGNKIKHRKSKSKNKNDLKI